MKASELRIGNYLNSDGVVVTIDGRSIFDIWTDEHLKIPIKYKPVQLTPEWIERLGFVTNAYSTEGVQYSEPFCHIELEVKGWRFNYNEDFGWVIHPVVSDYNLIPVKYVHVLQNVVFALTGHELTTSYRN